MSKHTPGPWEARGWSIKYPGNGVRVCVVDQADKALKQFGDYDEDMAVCKANARLIAAAPELLEALRNLLADAESLGIDDSTVSGSAIEARAALAKANGEGGR